MLLLPAIVGVLVLISIIWKISEFSFFNKPSSSNNQIYQTSPSPNSNKTNKLPEKAFTLIKAKDADEVDIFCTTIYQENYTPPFLVIDEAKNSFQIKDEVLLKLIKEADISGDPSQGNPAFMTGSFCKTSDLEFLIASLWSNEDGLRIIFKKPDGKIIKIISKTNGAPYFSCSHPTSITKSNFIELNCSGGDGGYGKTSEVTVDLNRTEVKIGRTCEYITSIKSTEPYTEETEEKCTESI